MVMRSYVNSFVGDSDTASSQMIRAHGRIGGFCLFLPLFCPWLPVWAEGRMSVCSEARILPFCPSSEEEEKFICSQSTSVIPLLHATMADAGTKRPREV
jgi:hypothetical protein